jgi:hypothetical protein
MKVKEIKERTGLSLSRIYKIIETIEPGQKSKIDNKWNIDEGLINRHFIRKRIPKIINKKSVTTYSIGRRWNYVGNFHLSRLSLKDNRSYSDLLFNHLPENSEMVISFEKNSKDEFYHTHFLIKTSLQKRDLEGILDHLVGQRDIGKGKDYLIEIFDEKRDYGVFYTLKSDVGFDIKKK